MLGLEIQGSVLGVEGLGLIGFGFGEVSLGVQLLFGVM